MSSLPPLLIVDDDPDDIFILKRLLLKAGIENKTVAFEDPSLAMVHLEAVIRSGDRRLLPAVLFTDLNMPQMSGHALTRWKAAQPALAETRVIMVSSSEDPADRAAALAAGADAFYLKYPAPSVLQSLLSCVPADAGG